MSFTLPNITHVFQSPPGTAASGTVEFSLLGGWMTNGVDTVISPMIVTATLSGTGALSVTTLPSNIDPGTQPAAPWNTSYRMDIKLTGAQTQSFDIIVPPIQTETNATTTSGSNVVQLSALTASWWMIGQSITGTGIPTGTIITGAESVTGTYPQQTAVNQIILSNNATASGTGVSLTLGDSIDLGYLMPTIMQPL